MTQLLHTAGLFVGDDLIGAMPSNPYGHFEDRRVVAIHDSILADNGEFWQVDREFIPYIHPRRWHLMRSFVADRRANHGLWGFKDPRVPFHGAVDAPDSRRASTRGMSVITVIPPTLSSAATPENSRCASGPSIGIGGFSRYLTLRCECGSCTTGPC